VISVVLLILPAVLLLTAAAIPALLLGAMLAPPFLLLRQPLAVKANQPHSSTRGFRSRSRTSPDPGPS
jgi:hypothetical protein